MNLSTKGSRKSHRSVARPINCNRIRRTAADFFMHENVDSIQGRFNIVELELSIKADPCGTNFLYTIENTVRQCRNPRILFNSCDTNKAQTHLECNEQ